MKAILTGNEAVARGAYEAGICYAAAYPGTPSTEILENIAQYQKEIIAEWESNEKVAMEAVIGASFAGGRALAAMKHVGLNVAADPLMTFGYTGVNGGMIIVSADDPGMHSSQNEQDNRFYAKFAKIAMLEPSDSQEAKDMVKIGVELSEQYDTPVLFRMTTRVCHSKGVVELGEKMEPVKKPYYKDILKHVATPVNSKKLRVALEQRLADLEEYANTTPLNFTEMNGKEIGVITSGIAYQYAKEVFGDNVSYLKLGFTYPLPRALIRDFATQVDTLYIVEELEPYLEDQIKAAGIVCTGKELIPNYGELNPDILRKALRGEETELLAYDKTGLAARPPVLCAGCPHRGFFYELAKRKDVMVTGDIGCYTLGANEPLNAIDSVICMGASISMGHGAQKVFDYFGEKRRAVAVIGESTFFHSGINSLLSTAYNQGNTITCILDNRITGMTGHQENPGTGYTLQGAETKAVAIEPLVRAMGIGQVRTVNPLKLDEVKAAFDWALGIKEPVVIITRWPCVLKKHSPWDQEEFGDYFSSCVIDQKKCSGCKRCVKMGCPALQYDKEKKKVAIDKVQCTGCGICKQICKLDAIGKAGE